MLPTEWTDYGAQFGADGKLYLAEWRHGFTIHQLRALFFDCQRVRSLESELSAATARLARLEAELEGLEKRAAFYRRQCTLEARMGLALARIGA